MRRLTLTAALCTPLLWACGPTTSTTGSASSGKSTKGSSAGSGLFTGATSGSVGASTGASSTAGSGTAGTGSSGGPGAGTSGSSGTSAGPCTAMTVAAARAAAVEGASVCPTNVVTLMASSFGAVVDGGGTQYAGTYYMIDPTSGLAIEVYKSKHVPPTSTDPERGASVDLTGTVTVYPFDGGTVGLPEVESPGLGITSLGVGTLPTPVLATPAQLAPQGPDGSLIGHYVQVGPGQWTQNNAPTELTTTNSRGAFPHGAKLTDADGGALLIETYTFRSSANNCIPADGGEPDFTGGNFRGVFDQTQTYDGNFNRILYFGHCDIGPPAATTASTGSIGSSSTTTASTTSSGTIGSSATGSSAATTGSVSANTTSSSSSAGSTTGTSSSSSTTTSSSVSTSTTSTSASSSSSGSTGSSGSSGSTGGVAICGACTSDGACASGCCDDGSETCGFTSGFCNAPSGCFSSSDCGGIACDTTTFSCECPGFGSSSSSGSSGTSGSSSGSTGSGGSSGSTGSSGSSGNTCASCTDTSQCPGGHCLKETGGAGNYFCGPDCTGPSDTSCPTGFTCSEIETGEYGCRSAAPTCD